MLLAEAMLDNESEYIEQDGAYIFSGFIGGEVLKMFIDLAINYYCGIIAA